ncbi:helix-turn-helix transcriptional regulator [Niallia sp. MER 6]|uniref:helix-turn-helix domain-containing protein n=1 Tax=Niallia sp. MER 6 TaxID=2939567 RepID=UPI00203F792D|nr:helix-turn-helix transcriptional regulator [Niallia sp. MER 6]MCM3032825.1 helix-turn-helix transcriptional regulator [Niallia sp. MER 6]
MEKEKTIESTLKEIIESRGIKVSWISNQSGISRNTIHTYINGGVPALDKAYAIAEVLDLSVYDIWVSVKTSEK